VIKRRAGSGAFSLKRRLLLSLLSAVALIWLAMAGFSFLDARREINELLDAHLAQSASLLLVQLRDRDDHKDQDDDDDDDDDDDTERFERFEDVDIEHAPVLHRYSREVVFQIWWHGQRLLLHSLHAPNERLSRQERGFDTAAFGGERWRVFSTWDAEGDLLIQVGERLNARERIAHEIGEHLLQPLLIALAVLAAIIWFGVGRGLRPLTLLGEQVARRDPANLTALAVPAAPREVVPLLLSLNRLFEQVRASLNNERRFTADAAHELRTPLAALRAQAQVALAATDEAQRQRALQQVIAGCDRATHLVEQLLTLARLEPVRLAQGWPCTDLRALTADVIAELAPQALRKNIELELNEGPPLRLRGESELLAVLLRNLIDNAIRYSPADTQVAVRIEQTDGQAVLRVSDQGSGLPKEEQARVWQRFYRVMGSGESGSGLGLSIVKRIAELHAATLELSTGPQGRGLTVTLRFSRQGKRQ